MNTPPVLYLIITLKVDIFRHDVFECGRFLHWGTYLGLKKHLHFSRHADVNECTDGTHTCDSNAACTNNDGGFTCACNSGFTGDGQTGGSGCTGRFDENYEILYL